MRADHIKNFCRLEGVDYMTSEYACQEFEFLQNEHTRLACFVN